jgi:hypothetical protein
MAADLIAAVRAIDANQISKPEQRAAFLAYVYLFVNNGTPDFVPSFPPNMYRRIEETDRKDYIIIDNHSAMLDPGWLGCKTLDGQPNPSAKIWTSNKTLETSLTAKFLLALEVYHHLDLHGQVPESMRVVRTVNGHSKSSADSTLPRAAYFTWNQKQERWSVGKGHPLANGRVISGDHTRNPRTVKLFMMIKKLEELAQSQRQVFVFPSFNVPGIAGEYEAWKSGRPSVKLQEEIREYNHKRIADKQANKAAKRQKIQDEAQRKLVESGGLFDF